MCHTTAAGRALPFAGQRASHFVFNVLQRPKNACRTFQRKLNQPQAFDPSGVSTLDEAPLETVWNIVKSGDKWAKFFSELAADDTTGGEYRVGVGLSRLAEVLAAAITELRTREDLRMCLKENVLQKALQEADALMPHFERLNAGKAAMDKPKEPTFGNLKRRKTTGGAESLATPTPEQLRDSAGAVYDWLQKGTDSNLRMLMAFLGAGGVFWAAQAADKTARAWLQHKQPAVTKDPQPALLPQQYLEGAKIPRQWPRDVPGIAFYQN